MRPLLLSTIACAFALPGHVSAAPPVKRSLDPLTVLLEHGLPDVRGAQRVSVEYSIRQDLIGHAPDRHRVKEPAWLLREEPGGRLTVLLTEVREMRGQRATVAELNERDDAGRRLPPEPQMVITPLDVRDEIKRLLQGEKAPARKQAESTVDNPYPPGEWERSPSETLLLLAHLQQRRYPEVKALLGRVLPAAALRTELDEALEDMANAQLENLYDRWIETGDAGAFATGLETLVQQSWRAWPRREGVRLLAGYARAAATQPPESEIAALLSGLRDANIPELPLETNWLLPKSQVPRLPPPDAHRRVMFSLRSKVIFLTPVEARAAAATPLATFFDGRLAAAKLLLPLLDSHRPSRILRDDSYKKPNGSVSPKQKPQTIYQDLYRPHEVGELAAFLLEAIYPIGYLSGEPSEELKQHAAEWVDKLDGKSDEEVAWLYLETCEQPAGRIFEGALATLVELRAPAAPGRLKDFLRDPMIWSWPLVETLAPLLPAYLDALGPERAAFGADLLLALKTGIDARPQIGSTYTSYPDAAWGGNITWEPELGPRALKLLRLLVEGSTLAGLVNRFALLEGPDAEGVLDALRIGVVGHFDRDLEAQLFQTAARLNGSKRRMDLLEIARHFRGAIKPGPPMDGATRAAVERLLDDDAGVRYLTAPLGDTAEMALYALLHPRFSAEQETLWEGLEIEPVANAWKKLAVAAALAGEALPPVPAGPDLTTDEITALTAAWKDWSGAEVLAAARALPLEMQLRLIRGLSQQTRWPAWVVRAQLTMAEVDEAVPEPQRWKGRTFDQKLREELAAVIRAGAVQGRHWELTVDARHALSGLSLSVREFKEDVYMTTRKQLAEHKLSGLARRTPPDALGKEMLTFWRIGWYGNHEAAAITPIWKDQAVTASWLKAFGDRPTPRSAYPHDSFASVHNPPALRALLSRMESGEPKLVRRFRFESSASPLVEKARE